MLVFPWPKKNESKSYRYLLINYRLGDLLGKVSDTDRKSTLQKSRAAYERYLSLLSHYDILSPSEKKLHRLYHENPATFSTISTTNAEARRAAKIANYNEEKELKRKLDVGITQTTSDHGS
jgi:immunoglobulin-binding protein 1